MRVIIAGSRSITSYATVCEAIKASGFDITKVVSGCARGVDQNGEEWAFNHKIPVKLFHAFWNEEGKQAGPRRNQRMAEYAEALIAIWDGLSPGTRDMIERANKHGLKVFVYPAK